KSIDILDCISYITLAHSLGIHGHNLVLNATDITGSLRNDLWLKSCLAVTRNINRNFTIGSFYVFGYVSISAVICILITVIIRFIAKVRIHFSLKHCFKHGTKDIFDSFLHILFGLWLVLF